MQIKNIKINNTNISGLTFIALFRNKAYSTVILCAYISRLDCMLEYIGTFCKQLPCSEVNMFQHIHNS